MLAALAVALTIAQPQPIWVDCGHVRDVRPAGITVACGDGNFWVSRLTWKTWGNKSATAIGVGHLNDCKPYCAAGHFHTEKITIRLSGVKTCGGHRALFSRITWRWARPKPAWRGRYVWNGSDTYPCTWLRPKR